MPLLGSGVPRQTTDTGATVENHPDVRIQESEDEGIDGPVSDLSHHLPFALITVSLRLRLLCWQSRFHSP